jgi:carbon storage regulator
MLVLSRKKNQRVFVKGREIVITVVEIRGDMVRLGIDAPPEVTVHREEVFLAIEGKDTVAQE